jgi:hypothetical protein
MCWVSVRTDTLFIRIQPGRGQSIWTCPCTATALMSRYRAGKLHRLNWFSSAAKSLQSIQRHPSMPSRSAPPSPRAQPSRTVAFVVARALATRATGRDDVSGFEARMRKAHQGGCPALKRALWFYSARRVSFNSIEYSSHSSLMAVLSLSRTYPKRDLSVLSVTRAALQRSKVALRCMVRAIAHAVPSLIELPVMAGPCVGYPMMPRSVGGVRVTRLMMPRQVR